MAISVDHSTNEDKYGDWMGRNKSSSDRYVVVEEFDAADCRHSRADGRSGSSSKCCSGELDLDGRCPRPFH